MLASIPLVTRRRNLASRMPLVLPEGTVLAHADEKFLFTSESVTEGHPDKIADQISDAVLDAVLTDDPMGRVACETLVTTALVVVAGGYSDKAETWVNTGALLNRLNFALSFAGDKVAGATVDLKSMLGDAAVRDPNAALSQAIDAFLGDQIAEQTRATLTARLNDPQILQASLDDPVKQVNGGLIAGLVLGAPEFQRR